MVVLGLLYREVDVVSGLLQRRSLTVPNEYQMATLLDGSAKASGQRTSSNAFLWKQQTITFHGVEFAFDRPRPKQQKSNGRRLRFEFPKELYQSLEELSRAEGVTPFIAALAVYQVLLYRYTAQEEILVGSPSANRNKFETERLIGFLLNTLVLRGDLSGDRVRESWRASGSSLGAYDQRTPVSKMGEELNVERNH